MSDQKRSGTSRVGYTPNIEQPVGEVTLGLEGAAAAGGAGLDLTDLRAPDAVDRVSEADRVLIDQFLNTYTEAKERLDTVDRQLEQHLAGLAVPYNPTTYPDLHEAHHHICGRPGSANIITYADVKQRAAIERSQLQKTIGLPDSLDDLNEMNAAGVQGKISTNVNKAILQMLDAVWRQIIVWVLEFQYQLVKPLERIKFVKAIPKFFKRAIDKLKRSPNAGPLNMASLIDDDIQVGEEGELPDEGPITSEDLAKAGGGYITSIKEVLQELPPECLIHTANFNRVTESLVRDGPYASAYYAKKVNGAMIERLEALNKMAAVGIPNGHLFTYKGTQLSYVNPLPEEYLQARADGSTRFGALAEGLMDSSGQVLSTFVPKVERLARTLIADPEILCCLLRNLTFLANSQNLRKTLLYIQALLQLWRNFHVLDLAKEIARLGNMIMDLLNRVLQSIFSLYIAYFNDRLSKFAVKIKDLHKLTNTREKCQPWLLLIDLAVEILTEMLQKITSYLSGFFTQFRLDIRSANFACDELQKMSIVDRYLDLINKILRFAAAWAVCIENGQDPRVILNRGQRLRGDGNGITLDPRPATNTTGGFSAGSGGSGAGAGGTAGTGTSAGNAGSSLPADGPFSRDGLQVLLTNYLGTSNEKAREVIDGIDDCSCDKSLTPEELADIERFIEEKA